MMHWLPPRPGLSRSDDDLLKKLEGFVALHGRLPTFRYLQIHFQWGRAKIERMLNRLEAQGYLQRHPAGTIAGALVRKDGL